jgi:hypothetical protein
VTDQHPITPPPELVRKWHQEWIAISCNETVDVRGRHIATQAAQWGADTELEACINWLDRNNQWARVDLDELRDGRRPKPQSLKEQALDRCNDYIDPDGIIRRALEALPDE